VAAREFEARSSAAYEPGPSVVVMRAPARRWGKDFGVYEKTVSAYTRATLALKCIQGATRSKRRPAGNALPVFPDSPGGKVLRKWLRQNPEWRGHAARTAQQFPRWLPAEMERCISLPIGSGKRSGSDDYQQYLTWYDGPNGAGRLSFRHEVRDMRPAISGIGPEGLPSMVGITDYRKLARRLSEEAGAETQEDNADLVVASSQGP